MKKLIKKVLALFLITSVCFGCVDITAFAAGKLDTPEVSISVSSKSKPTIKVSWEKVTGATDYYVYRTDKPESSLSLIGTTSDLYYKDSDISLNTVYYYKVKACITKSGKIKQKSDVSKTVSAAAVKLGKPRISTAAVSDSSVKLSIGKISGADKYYIYYSSNKSSDYKCIGYTTKDSYTFKKLQSSTTYYFKARPAKTINGKDYKGSYSDVSACKTSLKKDEHVVDFKRIPNGKDLPTGSAITCLAMILNHYGIEIDKMEMLKYFYCSTDFYEKDGVLWGPSCIFSFVGDPKSNVAYGKGAGSVFFEGTFYKYIRETKTSSIKIKTDKPGVEEYKDWLDKGNILIATIKVKNSYEHFYWKFDGGKDNIHIEMPQKYERYAIVCGYTDDGKYIVYDPMTDSFEKYFIYGPDYDMVYNIIWFENT